MNNDCKLLMYMELRAMFFRMLAVKLDNHPEYAIIRMTLGKVPRHRRAISGAISKHSDEGHTHYLGSDDSECFDVILNKSPRDYKTRSNKNGNNTDTSKSSNYSGSSRS